MKMNRLANAKNEFQGTAKKVLCVCSAGLLRSPTAAVVLASEPFGFNTRACGLSQEFALIPIDEVLIHWADEIVCMEREHFEILIENPRVKAAKKLVICLDIEDSFPYMDDGLKWLIKEKYQKAD